MATWLILTDGCLVDSFQRNGCWHLVGSGKTCQGPCMYVCWNMGMYKSKGQWQCSTPHLFLTVCIFFCLQRLRSAGLLIHGTGGLWLAKSTSRWRKCKVPHGSPSPNRSKFTRKYLVYGLGVFATIAAVWLAATDGGGGGDDGYLWGVPDVAAHDFI